MAVLYPGFTDKQCSSRGQPVTDPYQAYLFRHGCTDSGWTTETWNTISQPVAQAITKLPNVSDVCVTGTVSATFSGGSGGVSPTDVYESSVDGGATWASYTPGSPIAAESSGTGYRSYQAYLFSQRAVLIADGQQ